MDLFKINMANLIFFKIILTVHDTREGEEKNRREKFF